MRTLLPALATLSLIAIAPFGVSTHDQGCVLSVAPGTTIAIGDVYLNDRHTPNNPPGTGLLAGGGTWLYIESNGILDLQLGGSSPIGDTDPEEGQLCTHAPDTLIF